MAETANWDDWTFWIRERCQAFLGRNAERRGLRGRGWALQRLGGVSGGVAIIVVVIILSFLLL